MIRHAVSIACFLAAPAILGAATPEVHGALARLPLRFETAADGRLVAREGPCSLLVAPGQTTVTVSDRRNHRAASVVTKLAGANLASHPEGDGPLAATATYLIGRDPAGWRTGTPLFARAVSRGVYRGIDLVFHGDEGSLEYDFVVHPGASAQRIALDVSGASAVRLASDGALDISTPAGGIRWKKPVVYQWKDGVRQPVAGAFALRGRRVTFAIGAYDRSSDLVIDPTLTYATYLGGNDNDTSHGVAVDASGNIYVTGFTFSMNLATAAGSYQSTYHGGTYQADTGGDAFVAKYSPAGALLYVTYLGGRVDDVGSAIAVDSAGNAYVTGYTSSPDFPTVKGSYQTTYGGQGANRNLPPFGDAFVAKLNPTGTALVYSTYLGGSGDEKGAAIAVDSNGSAYVGGATLSTNFPTKNAYQAAYKGSGGNPDLCSGGCGPLVNFGDGFIAKLTPDGTGLVFSTYLGGALDDAVTAIALDSAGNVYAGGSTLSSDFPTLGAFQSKYGGAASDSAQPVIKVGDGFVAKFDTTGKLLYSTYLGGSGDDAVMAIAADATGAAYVTGFTTSSNFPVTAGAAQHNFTGPSGVSGIKGFAWGDAFVAKLAPSGSSLVWATYLGGSDDDAGMAIAVDAGGNAIVGGFANSTNLAVTSGAQQKTLGGTNGPPYFSDPTGDAFLAKVAADGSSFLYLSYYGGNSSDAITALALDGKGNVMVGGTTTSTNLPLTANAAQKTFGGQDPQFETEVLGDAFVAVFSGVASAPAVPTITSVVNAGSYTTSLAPGSVAEVIGTNLPTNASAGALLGGKAVTVTYASATGWMIAIPYNAATGATTVQVGTSAPFPITLSRYAPALLTIDGTTIPAYRVLSGSMPYVTASAPAFPGDTLYFYATGLGAIDSNGSTNPLPAVSVGGQVAKVFSVNADSIIAPGQYIVTIQLPCATPAGNPGVVLSIGGSSSQSLTLPVGTLTIPAVTDAENGASFLPGVTPNAWFTLKGCLLASTTDTWSNAIVGGILPTTLDGASVKVGGQSAYVYVISPGQINVVAPNIAAGATTVTVTNAAGTSAPFNATAQIFGPAFFLWSGVYAAATRTDYTLAVKNGTFPGATTVAAKPGDVLILWGTGFGPTNPAAPVGVQIPPNSYPTANPVTVTVGGVPATVYGAALAPGYAALFQVAIQVPPSLADGDYPVVATVSGASSPNTTLLTVQR
jgi:uncharacterized protein (TIGR03437 family)